MFRPVANFSRALLLVILAGCAHQPDMRSARQKQAIALANQGEKAYLGGNEGLSREYYERALQINSSIENEHGIAVNTLSLAQLNLERGEYEQAEAKLQFILGNKDHLFDAGDRADAVARSAALALLLKQPGKAAEFAQQAQILCTEAGCLQGAAIFNLHAQAAMALDQAGESADFARQAGALAEKTQQPVELANSRRLLGEIQLQLKSATNAIPLLEQALSLDKQLGLAKKIAEDLRLMADARELLGQHEEAASYRNRDRAIRAALGEKRQ